MRLDQDLKKLHYIISMGRYRDEYLPKDFTIVKKTKYIDYVKGDSGVIIPILWRNSRGKVLYQLYQNENTDKYTEFDPYNQKPNYLLDDKTVLKAYIRNSTHDNVENLLLKQ